MIIIRFRFYLINILANKTPFCTLPFFVSTIECSFPRTSNMYAPLMTTTSRVFSLTFPLGTKKTTSFSLPRSSKALQTMMVMMMLLEEKIVRTDRPRPVMESQGSAIGWQALKPRVSLSWLAVHFLKWLFLMRPAIRITNVERKKMGPS